MTEKIKNSISVFGKKHTWSFDILILTLIYFIAVRIVMGSGNAFGSVIDWSSQHYVFPEYFRMMFYETGELFPSFAPHIGSGENIYNFSYYGLFSPLIMLSYLFPFIKMHYYIQIISILSAWVSVVLLYLFMKKRAKRPAAFITALIFLFSPPLIFHSHRHIMFVSYMPFLILSLGAVDNLIKKKLCLPFIICLTLTILSSYFFAVPCIISTAVYFVYSFLKNVVKPKKADIARAFLRYGVCVITAVMISAVLLLPTFAAILNGREATVSEISLRTLLPFSELSSVTLTPYAMCLSAFGILSVISALLCRDSRHRRVLGIFFAVTSVLPVFSLILNGGMYISGKPFIPFIPLLMILIADMYEEFTEKKDISKKIYILFAVCVLMYLILYSPVFDFKNYGSLVIFGFDIILSSVFLLLYIMKRKRLFLILCMSLSTVIVCFAANYTDKLLPRKKLDYEQEIVTKEMMDVIASDGNLVRSSVNIRKADTVNKIYGYEFYSPYIYSSLHNRKYNDFYFEHIQNENEYRNSSLTACSSNILFNIFIGNKYMVSASPSHETGYKVIYEYDDRQLLRNEYAMPVGRSSDKLISRSEYDKLSVPEKAEALMKCIVVDEESGRSDYVSSCMEYPEIKLPEDGRIKEKDGCFTVESDTPFRSEVILDEPVPENKLLMIFFDVKNLKDDTDARIRINGMKNTLTAPNWIYYNNNENFGFILSSQDSGVLSRLDFTFSGGCYSISNIRAYTIDLPAEHRLTGEFVFDKQHTKGDNIAGSISCDKDGYFLLTIPYDDNFTVEVDSRPQKYDIADCAFIGFPISKGRHDIRIGYTAPFLNEAKIISLIGILGLAVFAIFDLRNLKSNL